jgi:Asp-tRNA(Asn)/Glu-tRNA(Gln) amidotransferase C subunit
VKERRGNFMIQREEILKLFEQLEERIEDMDHLLTTSIHQEKAAGIQSIEKQKRWLLDQLADIETNVEHISYIQVNHSSIRKVAL